MKRDFPPCVYDPFPMGTSEGSATASAGAATTTAKPPAIAQQYACPGCFSAACPNHLTGPQDDRSIERTLPGVLQQIFLSSSP
jgi:hypothetical protein